MPSDFYDGFMRTDPICRENLVASLKPGTKFNEIETILKSPVPFTLLIGRDDEFTNNSYLEDLNFQGKIKYIENCGHFPQMEKPSEFNKLLLEHL